MSELNLTDFLAFARLEELLGRFAGLRVGLVGDVALDGYWYADMTRARLSRETPHFARPVVRAEYGPGAGANVAQNLAALGAGAVSVFSVVGQDLWAVQLRAELVRRGIRTHGLVEARERCTPAYLKPILMGYVARQEDARLDFENDQPLSAALEDELLARLESELDGLDAVLVADQFEENGVVTARVRARLAALAQQHPDTPFLADSRARIALFAGMLLKPNELEAAQALGLPAGTPPAELGRALALAAGRPVFLTLGEQGVLVCTPAGQQRVPAAPVTPPLDIVGAGDTFLAALACALAAGAAPLEAAALANLAAAVTVEKLNQTGTAAPDEIRARCRLVERIE